MSFFPRIPFIGDFELEYPSTAKGIAYFDTVYDEQHRTREIWIAYKFYFAWAPASLKPRLLTLATLALLAIAFIGIGRASCSASWATCSSLPAASAATPPLAEALPVPPPITPELPSTAR